MRLAGIVEKLDDHRKVGKQDRLRAIQALCGQVKECRNKWSPRRSSENWTRPCGAFQSDIFRPAAAVARQRTDKIPEWLTAIPAFKPTPSCRGLLRRHVALEPQPPIPLNHRACRSRGGMRGWPLLWPTHLVLEQPSKQTATASAKTKISGTPLVPSSRERVKQSPSDTGAISKEKNKNQPRSCHLS